jgi:hypothetical protein
MGGVGRFGALFRLAGLGYRDPILVSSTDGVGTKQKLAVALDGHDTIGIDRVAMCVKGMVLQGAELLFFLDYYFATGRLDVEVATRVIAGIATGCKQAGAAGGRGDRGDAGPLRRGGLRPRRLLRRGGGGRRGHRRARRARGRLAYRGRGQRPARQRLFPDPEAHRAPGSRSYPAPRRADACPSPPLADPHLCAADPRSHRPATGPSARAYHRRRALREPPAGHAARHPRHHRRARLAPPVFDWIQGQGAIP